jgi:hypothetical protein
MEIKPIRFCKKRIEETGMVVPAKRAKMVMSVNKSHAMSM